MHVALKVTFSEVRILAATTSLNKEYIFTPLGYDYELVIIMDIET